MFDVIGLLIHLRRQERLDTCEQVLVIPTRLGSSPRRSELYPSPRIRIHKCRYPRDLIIQHFVAGRRADES